MKRYVVILLAWILVACTGYEVLEAEPIPDLEVFEPVESSQPSLPFTVFQSFPEEELALMPERAEMFAEMFSFDIPDGVLSIEEVALIGADYIEQMLGFDISGQVVEVFWEDMTASIGQYWRGRVGSSPEAIAARRHHFEFMVDAFTGEWISVQHHWDETVERHEVEHGVTLSSEEITWLTGLAEEFAVRHFKDSEVVDVIFLDAGSFAISPMSDEGQILEVAAWFDVMDNRGRTAAVVLSVETGRLRIFGVSTVSSSTFIRG